MEDMNIYLIDNNDVNREKTSNFLKTLYATVLEYNRITDIVFCSHKSNSVLIFNGDTEHNIDVLREKGVILPVIISNQLKKTENYYNYSLSYPFNNEEIYQTLIDIKTRMNIVYLDKTVQNSILVKNMLNRLNNYNIYVESRLDKLESIIKSLNIQLIILDSSILGFYANDYPSKLLKSLDFRIPILLILNNKESYSFNYYTEKICKPFNLETLNNKIIKCFS